MQAAAAAAAPVVVGPGEGKTFSGQFRPLSLTTRISIRHHYISWSGAAP
jgi:hypothetical protein